MAWTLQDAKALRGLTVVDPQGRRIGTLQDIYLDRHTGAAEWAAVRTGRFGAKVSYVPIADAHTDPAGDVVVHVPKELVESAPRAELEDALHPEEERVLYEHYGRSDYADWDRVDRTADLDLPAEPAPAEGEPVVVVRLRRVVVVGVGADAP